MNDLGTGAVADWPFPRVIAHRGGGSLAPENTLAAFEVAARCGCRGVEVDARLSADGTPFLIHDATLDRTTTGTGRVARATDATLRALDAGRRHGAAFAGEPLPTLEAALRRCLALGLWANVEIKADAGDEDACGRAVASVVQQVWRGPPPQPSSSDTAPAAAPAVAPELPPPLLSSFSTAALAGARAVAPELPRALLVGALPRDWCARAGRLGCVAIHSKARRTSPAAVAAVRAAGLAIACYTVDDPQEAARLFALGVAAVFTDRPDRFTPSQPDRITKDPQDGSDSSAENPTRPR